MVVRASSKSRFYRGARRGISLKVVLLCGSILVAGFIARNGGTSATATPESPMVVAEFDTVKVPVPAHPVPPGTKVKDISFNWIQFPKHQVSQKAMIDLEEYLEDTTTTALPANLPLFRENLSASRSNNNPVIQSIPPGMRAMTIKVDATTAVEGWAGSGSLVDVLLVGKESTTVVAEKVKILSAERSVSPVDGDDTPSVPSTVTLLVTQDQCLAINTAIPLGKIAFALRSERDENSWGGYLCHFLYQQPKFQVRLEMFEVRIQSFS